MRKRHFRCQALLGLPLDTFLQALAKNYTYVDEVHEIAVRAVHKRLQVFGSGHSDAPSGVRRDDRVVVLIEEDLASRRPG